MSDQPKTPLSRQPETQQPVTAELRQPQAPLTNLTEENTTITAANQELHRYIRDKTNQLLKVMGSLPLKAEELDDETLIEIDPIGIVSESFSQVLEHLQETNDHLSLVNDEIQAIFNTAGAGILMVDNQRRLTTYNRKCQELFFPDTTGPITKTCCELICQQETPPDNCVLNHVIATQQVAEQTDFTTNNRHYHVIGTPIKNKENITTHVILVYTDITERKLNEKALRESEERYRTLYSTMQEGVAIHRLIHDRDGLPCDYEMVDVNPGYETILGFTREEVVGRMASEIYPLVNGGPPCLDIFSEVALSGQPTTFEYHYKALNKSFKISSAQLSPGYFANVFEDITQRKQDEEKIERLAYFDSLTGLPNRALMRDRLGQMVSRAKRTNNRIGLFFLDLDYFKRINDTMGHDKGDQLLKIIANRLARILRSCDSISRLGGDEFVVLVDDLHDRDAAALVACKILEALAQPFVLEGKEIYTTTSVGIAMFPEDGDDPDTLLKNADAAMYQSKDSGRNTYRFYSSEINAQTLEKLLLANDLRKALDQQQFYLAYQPQIDLSNGQMSGVEALLRWNHPELGNISPVQFIPLAEETGLILAIGRWVLETACRAACELQQHSPAPLRVAINLSAKQFQDTNLVTSIKEVLQETGLPAELLELEITESILMDNVESAQNTLRQLKEMGLKLSIDDFGTGYSSLSYLRHFPIDRLKVDKSFVQRLTTHPDDASITEAIIVMAHIIGIRVVAEGVELRDELDFLRDKQCDEVQGFYFSRPLQTEQLIERIQGPDPSTPFCFFNT